MTSQSQKVDIHKTTVSICRKTRAKAHAYRLADRHIRTLTYIQIRCYSSAVLWVLWRLWRCEGKKALEAPTGLLPNGRVDIYPGRLWAVAPTEMIQPAIRNIGIYSDGWNSHGEGSGDVWGLCVYILSLNLPTHCIWHGCYLSHEGAMLTVILNSTWWREECQWDHKVSVFHRKFCGIIHASTQLLQKAEQWESQNKLPPQQLSFPFRPDWILLLFWQVMFPLVTNICLYTCSLFESSSECWSASHDSKILQIWNSASMFTFNNWECKYFTNSSSVRLYLGTALL